MNMNIVITEKKTVEATPELLAKIFWEMDNDEQADFFDALAIVADRKLSDQMENVASFTDGLTQKALDAMIAIGHAAELRNR